MKTANEMPLYNAEKFMRKSYEVLEAKVMYAGIELGVFNHLRKPTRADELAVTLECDKRNLELLLNALTSIGFLKKEDDFFSNLNETDYYLNSDSDMYLGDHILYWRDMTSLDGITGLVRNGAPKGHFEDENGSDFFDFRAMGQGARNTMYLGRVQKFIQLVKGYFKPNQAFDVFDMGGGSGILSIEIARNFENASCVVFDQKRVIELTDEIIDSYEMQDRVKTLSGNFVEDDFTRQYDFIIASGVLDFVGDLDVMAEKLHKTLKSGGYLYVNTHGINKVFTAPSRYILGWLSSHLNGLDILKPDELIKESLIKAGFEIIDDSDGTNCIVRKR